MKIVQIILLAGLACLFTLNANATDLMGGEISYSRIDSLKYRVFVTFYRNCGGIPTSTPNAYVRCVNSSGTPTTTTVSLSLSLVSITDVSPPNCGTGFTCTPSNTRVSGSLGIEKHVFEDTLDLTLAAYASLLSCSNHLRIESERCCRNSEITTGAANQRFYFSSDLIVDPSVSNSEHNSSPIFTDQPIFLTCCNQPVRYNLGGIDTVDFDSISYAFNTPLSAYNQTTAYISWGSYSYQNPFQALFIPRNNPNLVIPNIDPPIGIYLNPETGQLVYTPTRCDEVTVAKVTATEWRKDTSGTYRKIGAVSRDLQVRTQNCPNNNPPTISGPFSYNVCEGSELCFIIVSKDEVFVPPPPNSPPPGDTTEISWTNAIPGSSIAILDSSARLKTARFCWTPKQGDANSMPYTFSVRVMDNACPVRGIGGQTFQITVLDSKVASSQINALSCGQFEITTQEDTAGFVGTPIYQNELYDENYNLIQSTSLALFASSDSSLARRSIKKDTITIFNSGIYYLKHLVEGSSASNCAQYNWDTLDLSSYFGVELNYSSDKICVNDTLKLSSTLVNTNATHTYAWYVDDTLRASDTLSTFNMHFPTANRDTTYRLEVTDTAGCVVKDFVHVQSGDSSNFTLGPDSLYCRQTVVVIPTVAQTYYAWNTGDSTSYLSVDSSGSYSLVGINAFNCVYTDTVDISVSKELPRLVQNYNYLACDTFTTVTADSTFDSYLWNTGDSSYSIILDSTTIYKLTVTDSNACVFSDSVNFKFYTTIGINIMNEPKRCDSLILTVPSSTFPSLLWEDSTSAHTRVFTDTSGLIWVQALDSNGCSSSDSIAFTYYPKPSIGLADTTFCTDSIFMEADSFNTYQWSFGDTTQQVWFTLSGKYSLRVSDSLSCTWTDSVQVGVGEPNLLGNVISCGAYSPILAPYLDSIAWADGSTDLLRRFQSDTIISATLYSKEGCTYSDTLRLTVNELNTFKLNDTTTCEDSLLLSTSGYRSILWNTGSNSFDISTDTSGIYYYVAKDTNGCSYSDTAAVQFFIITPLYLGLDTSVCDEIRLNISPDITSVIWNNGSTDTYVDISSTSTTSAVAQDSNGCISYDTISVSVNYSPLLSLPANVSTCDTSYSFSVSTIDSLLWNTGASDTSITVTTSGNYSVIQRTLEGCADTATVFMNFLTTDVLYLGPDTTICSAYTFSASTSTYSSFLWSDSSTLNSKNFDTAGTYWLTATNSQGCSSTDSITISTFTIAPISLANDTTCGDSIVIAGPSGFTSYLWSTGDTTSTTTLAVSRDVWLTVLDSNLCPSRDTASYTVFKTKQADLGPDLSRCGGSQTIRPNIFGANYLWNTGQTTAIINTFSSGQYFVDITLPNGCTTSDTINVNIYTQPSSGLPDSLVVCSDTGVVLASTAFSKTIWNTGDSTTSIFVNNSGRYSVAILDSFGCSNTDFIDLIINALPTVTLGQDTAHCGDSITLQVSGANQYLWNTNDTTNAITANASGTYTVKGTDLNNCINTDSVEVSFLKVPNPNLGNDTAYCSNSVLLSPGNFFSTTWSTGSTNANISVQNSGEYSVLVVDTNGCGASDTINLTVNNLPSINLGNDTTLCDDSLTLDAGNYTSTIWNTGSINQTINTTSSGTYTVLATDSNTCTNIDSINVIIYDAPDLNLGNDTTFCGDSLLLSLSTNNRIVWSTGDTLNFTAINSSGDYWVSITDTNGCPAADTVNVMLLSNTNTPVLTRNSDSINSNLSGIHHWFLDGSLTSDANTNTLAINGRFGAFTAVHEDSNGCFSDTSNGILRTATINKISNSQLKVYPNPTAGKVTIDATGLGTIRSVELYNSQGQLVEHQQKIDGPIAVLSWTAPSGIYHAVVHTDQGLYRAEVVNVR